MSLVFLKSHTSNVLKLIFKNTKGDNSKLLMPSVTLNYDNAFFTGWGPLDSCKASLYFVMFEDIIMQ